MRPLSEHDLQDPAEFARAYLSHAHSIHRTAMSVLHDAAAAHDVVHDVFLRLWRRPEAFDARRGGLGPYLRLMARSRALDVRREARAADAAREHLRGVERGEAAPPSGVDAIQRRELLAAMGDLTPGQQEAVVLAFWGDMSAAEISRRAGVPLGTVKSRVRLGLSKLRQAYGAQAA